MCSGHRIGTAEVESALVSHPQCAEAAVVGVEHEVCPTDTLSILPCTPVFSIPSCTVLVVILSASNF